MQESIEVGGQAVGISSEDRARLNEGEVLVTPLSPEGGGVSARALAVVEAPPDAVWPVVRDAEHFCEFMPRTKSSRIVSRSEEGQVVRLEISMPFPLKNLVSEVLSVITETEDRRGRRWSLVKGTYERNDGEWVVASWGDNRTLLGYWLDAKPKIVIPDAVIRKAQTGSLPDVFEAVRDRARQLG